MCVSYYGFTKDKYSYTGPRGRALGSKIMLPVFAGDFVGVCVDPGRSLRAWWWPTMCTTIQCGRVLLLNVDALATFCCFGAPRVARTRILVSWCSEPGRPDPARAVRSKVSAGGARALGIITGEAGPRRGLGVAPPPPGMEGLGWSPVTRPCRTVFCDLWRPGRRSC